MRIIKLIFGLTLLAVNSGMAEDAINTNWRGLAVKGYDVVAYFSASQPVEGDSDFEFKWMDATWRFSSEANRDKFAANPEKFSPQFGGYCSWAVSQGYTAGIDPKAWRIVDDKLYLNYSRKVQKTWEEDIPGNINRADANWPKLRDS
jgi:YHS domain-containing protein